MSFLHKLKQKEGKLVTLNYLLSHDICHPRKLLGRIVDVGVDYFVLEYFDKGKKIELLYPYPTPGLGFITLNCEEHEIEFQRDAFEYLSTKEVKKKCE